MSRKKQKPFLRRLRYLLLAAPLLFALSAVSYYFLPWSVRKPVHAAAPQVNRLLCRSGWRLVGAWDDLGIGGSDCAVPAGGLQGGRHAIGGLPAGRAAPGGPPRLLENIGYTVGYSETLRNPLWAAYRAFDVRDLTSPARPGHRKDQRSAAGVSPNDYKGSGYDRGHLAPNFAIATRYGSAAQRETFLMTNITPQKPFLNRLLWRDIEHRIAASYGRCFSDVWVVTGPVFNEPVRRLPSGVAIPDAFFKIIADLDGGHLRVMAFLISQDPVPYMRLRSGLVSVDRIEELTGLDFFPELPDELQADLEAKPAGRLWPRTLPELRYRLFGQTR